MSMQQPIVPVEGPLIQYMSTGITADRVSQRPTNRLLLAYFLRDPELSSLAKSLELLFFNNLDDEKCGIGLYSFFDHYEGYTAHHFIDQQGHFVFLLTKKQYSHRCANKCLIEFLDIFLTTFKKKIISSVSKKKCKEGELSKMARPIFVDIMDKYEDVEGVDALMRSQQKVEDAKSVMTDNVSLLLENQVCVVHYPAFVL